MKIAKSTVWSNAAGNRLVETGDEDAAVLFVAKGHKVPDSALEPFSNGEEFFEEPQDPSAIHKEHTPIESEGETQQTGGNVTLTRIGDPEEPNASSSGKKKK